LDDGNFGNPVQKAEGVALRMACALFGLDLHLYHEEKNAGKSSSYCRDLRTRVGTEDKSRTLGQRLA
jgi:hypothetical protein